MHRKSFLDPFSVAYSERVIGWGGGLHFEIGGGGERCLDFCGLAGVKAFCAVVLGSNVLEPSLVGPSVNVPASTAVHGFVRAACLTLRNCLRCPAVRPA